MKLIIAGSREINDYEFVKSSVEGSIDYHTVDLVVSGGCRGVDALGERWAKEHNIPVKIFPAEWGIYGQEAGPLRNSMMADFSDCLLAIPSTSSRGTWDMIKKMQDLGKTVFIWRYSDGD
jgi:hypothetical protein